MKFLDGNFRNFLYRENLIYKGKPNWSHIKPHQKVKNKGLTIENRPETFTEMN